MHARTLRSLFIGIALLGACGTTATATTTTTEAPESVRTTDDKAVVERSLARMKKELEDADARLVTLEKKTGEKAEPSKSEPK
ncbi:MAG: hypothetical protein IV100_05455 [Myxococcales bacterium]|nr:hypothetical protein [Myxococcales bacterium]